MAVSVEVADGLGVAVTISVWLGRGVIAALPWFVACPSKAGCSGCVSTLMPPIKSGRQMPNETNRSAHCQGLRSSRMGFIGWTQILLSP